MANVLDQYLSQLPVEVRNALANEMSSLDTEVQAELGLEVLKLINQASDPAAEAARLQVYTKTVLGVTQLFVRTSDGTVHQLSPGGLATVAPADISDSTNTVGAGTTAAKSDHVHAHGNRGGGTLHPGATGAVAGFMAAADKTKLDGIAAAAGTGSLFSTLWVDLNTVVPLISQDGSIYRPFESIQDAIDYAVANVGTSLSWYINCSFGDYSAETLTIPEDIAIVIEGPLRCEQGIMTIGPINWSVTGTDTSRIGLRRLGVKGAITVADGTSPAVNAVLTVEGCQLGDDVGGTAVSTTGTSVVTLSLAGASNASFEGVTSPIVQMIISADVLIDQGILLANGVQFRDTCTLVRSGTIHCRGCSFEQNLEATETIIEIGDSVFRSASPSLTFTGSAGLLTLDGLSNYSLLNQGGYVVNGVKNGSVVFSAALAVEPLNNSLLPRFNSNSPYLCMVLGSQADGDYSGIGNGSLFAGARRGTALDPPTNAPYVGISQWDHGGSYFGLSDTGRTIYYGGGGWIAPDAHNHQFYSAAGPYTETTDTGTLCLHIGTDSTSAFSTFWSRLKVKHQLAVESVISPSALSAGNNNDYNPTSLSSSSVLRLTAASGAILTGLAGGALGRMVLLINVDTVDSITISHADTASTAANRFFCPSAVSVVLPIHGSAMLWYDSTSSRWRVLS
jgi:hypothetical protein